MAYTLNLAQGLGETGLTLLAALERGSDSVLVAKDLAGITERPTGLGIYKWRYTAMPDGFEGSVVWYTGTIGAGTDFSAVTIKTEFAINPVEVERQPCIQWERITPWNIHLSDKGTNLGFAISDGGTGVLPTTAQITPGTYNLFERTISEDGRTGSSWVLASSGALSESNGLVYVTYNEFETPTWANGDMGYIEFLGTKVTINGVDYFAPPAPHYFTVMYDRVTAEGHTYGEPSGVPPLTASIATKIGFLYQGFRNKITVSNSAKTFHNDAGVAQWSKTLSDDGTTYQETEGA